MEFKGYVRENGSVGVRNHVVVLSTVFCANEIAEKVASKVEKAKVLTQNYHCLRVGMDIERVKKNLIGIGSNPNVHSLLLVGTGCESLEAKKIADEISKNTSRVKLLTIEKEGKYEKVVKRGEKFLREMVSKASQQPRKSCDLENLTIGIKCVGSSPFSAIASNPAVGKATDLLIENGGSAIFSETIELIGAGQVLKKRAKNPEVARKLRRVVSKEETLLRENKIDLYSSEPTPGNIKTGLTTIEEKSLGAIVKSGSKTLEDVLNYGENPKGTGLYFMDGPGTTINSFIGMFAAGVQVQIASLGGGIMGRIRCTPLYPGGLKTLPTLTVAGDPGLSDEKGHFDVYAGNVVKGTKSVNELGKQIFEKIKLVASGKLTKIEMESDYNEPLKIYGNPKNELRVL